jgi:hypothetical protein
MWRTEVALDSPTTRATKAIDLKSGEILGFATWQFAEKDNTLSTEPTQDGGGIPHRNRGGGDIGEPAIVKDVDTAVMGDYFTSTGHNRVQISNVTSSACKF